MTEPLEIGDFLPDIKLHSHHSKLTLLSRRMVGKAGVLFLYPDHQKPACQAILRAVVQHAERFDRIAHLFAITTESVKANADKAKRFDLPFEVILSDPDARVAESLAVLHNSAGQTDFTGSGAFTAFVVDTNRRILRIDRNVSETSYIEELLTFLEEAPKREAKVMGPTAPVLYVPNVLSEERCHKLIDVYNTQGNAPTGAQFDGKDGDWVMRFNPDFKIRRDHVVSDPDLISELRGLIGSRIVPEIFKAFCYNAAYHESLKLACYEGTDRGFFGPHRDNVNASSAHRRFAMSLNLNTGEYEGGTLRFPEYGPELYAPAAGDAVIFSCSLLHEAMPVTEGKRYALLTFLYGEDGRGQQQRQAPAAQPG